MFSACIIVNLQWNHYSFPLFFTPRQVFMVSRSKSEKGKRNSMRGEKLESNRINLANPGKMDETGICYKNAEARK